MNIIYNGLTYELLFNGDAKHLYVIESEKIVAHLYMNGDRARLKAFGLPWQVLTEARNYYMKCMGIEENLKIEI